MGMKCREEDLEEAPVRLSCMVEPARESMAQHEVGPWEHVYLCTRREESRVCQELTGQC